MKPLWDSSKKIIMWKKYVFRDLDTVATLQDRLD